MIVAWLGIDNKTECDDEDGATCKWTRNSCHGLIVQSLKVVVFTFLHAMDLKNRVCLWKRKCSRLWFSPICCNHVTYRSFSRTRLETCTSNTRGMLCQFWMTQICTWMNERSIRISEYDKHCYSTIGFRHMNYLLMRYIVKAASCPKWRIWWPGQSVYLTEVELESNNSVCSQ